MDVRKAAELEMHVSPFRSMFWSLSSIHVFAIAYLCVKILTLITETDQTRIEDTYCAGRNYLVFILDQGILWRGKIYIFI
jgi:hypothetical protein